MSGHGVVVAATGAASIGASLAVAPSTTVGCLGAGLAVVALSIAAVDARRFLIPDRLNAIGVGLGLLHAAVQGGGDPASVGAAVLRAVSLAALFWTVRAVHAQLRGREGIGRGDVKLAAVAGAWLDVAVIPAAIEIAALSALAVAGTRALVRGEPLRSTARLPFGLFLAPSIWIGWLLQTALLPSWWG